ncbi:MAG: Calx-beta domain-containing protein [Pseudomonadota bacterium]
MLVRTSVTNDLLDEPAEAFTLTATTTAGTTSNASAVGTATITDNDATPSLSINDITVNEAAGTATFTVTLSAASGQSVSVGYNTSNGTATAGTDYTSTTGTLTFAPGVTTQTVTVSIANDTTYEGSETFNVNLVTPTNATIADNLGLGTIRDDGTGTGGTDNDTPSLAVSDVSVTEGTNPYAQFTVSLSNQSATATTVSLALTAGTASGAGVDFGTVGAGNLQVSTNGGTTWVDATSVTIPAGSTSVLVRTPVTNDLLDEPAEAFTLTATTTAGTTSNASAVGTATITDNDATPTLSINDITVNEAAGTATFTVTLSAASGQSVSVGYNTSNGTATAGVGADYTATTGTLTFTPGVTTQTVTVTIANDTTYEGSETFNVNLVSPTNATIADNLGLGTIRDDGTGTGGTDNDTPSLAVSDVSVTEGTNPYAQFTVSLSNQSATATTVSLALTAGTASGAGVDFGTVGAGNLQVSTNGGTTWVDATSVTIAAGTSSVLVRTPITNDLLDEVSEAFTLTATRTSGTTSNASAVGTATITDNDPTPSLSINDITVNEAAGTATFTVTLSAASGQSVSVGYNTSNGTATAGVGADYTATSGTLTFAPGVTTQTITVTIANDTTYEGSETFNVNLVTPTNATIADNLGLGTIRDDGTGTGGTDNDTPSLAVSDVAVTEGTNPFAVFTVSLSNASATATTVSLALTAGTGAGAGIDFGTAGAGNLQVSTNGGTTWVDATSVTIPAGTTSVLVRTPITNDVFDEPAETFSLTATRTAGSTINASAVGTATITDNDAFTDANEIVSVNEDTTLNGSVLTGTTSYDGSVTVTTFTVAGNATVFSAGQTAAISGVGSLLINANGSYTFTPASNYSGPVPVATYTMTDGSSSDTSTLAVSVTPVADAPTLTAAPRSFLRATTFEELTPLSGANGWTRTAIQIGDGTWRTNNSGGSIESYFEGEYLQNGNFSNRVIELENNSGSPANLYTDVATVAGEVYHLAFDFAERINNQTSPFRPAFDNSQIDVFWNGTRVATLNTDTNVWTHFEMDLRASATGSTRLEFRATDSNSIGGIMDNISLQLTPNVGVINTATPLPTPVATLTDSDGSETLTLLAITNIPVGATVTDGTNSFTATLGSTTANITGWTLTTLSLTPPAGYTGNIALNYTATSTEAANGVSATSTTAVSINIVGALNAVPVSVNDTIVGIRDSIITGNVLSNDTDSDGNTLYVTSYSIGGTTYQTDALTTISGVGTIRMMSDGDFYFTPSSNWTGNVPTITYSIADEHGGLTSTALGTAATLNITVGNTGGLQGTAAGEALTGTAGAEIIMGYGGVDTITGLGGNDTLDGGAGNDVIIGGAGSDVLWGRAGNDTLTGGSGGADATSDTFAWTLADRGTAASPAIDSITDFNNSAPASGGDVLDLRDLLVNEWHTTPTTGNLADFLHFTTSAGTTTIEIKTLGNASTGHEQRIVLTGVDLTNGGSLTTDQAIIQDLLSKSKLVVD